MTTGDDYWFLSTLVSVRISHRASADGIAVLEHLVPPGDSPPLHLHRTQDEIFQVLDGLFQFRLGDETLLRGPGSMVLIPKGVPHSYRVESVTNGRFITITHGSDFEDFVRLVGRPAQEPTLPEHDGPPTGAALQTLIQQAGQFGIEFLGPHLEPHRRLFAGGES